MQSKRAAVPQLRPHSLLDATPWPAHGYRVACLARSPARLPLGLLLALRLLDVQLKTAFGPGAVPPLVGEMREQRHALTDPRQVAEPVGHLAACLGTRARGRAYTDLAGGHARHTARVPGALTVPRRTRGRRREDYGEGACCRHVPTSH